jgi:crotonobetaine/carnitine-CoA ligase
MEDVRAPLSLHSLIGADAATVPDAFVARARASPDRTFLIFEDQRWTYLQALEHVRRWAGLLGPLMAPSRRVASYITNQPAAMWPWLGTAWAGGVYVGLNRLHRGVVLEDMLRRSQATILVTESGAVDDLAAINLASLSTILFVDSVPDRARRWPQRIVSPRDVEGAPLADRAPSKPGDVASVLYTSGTTGRSKAALIPHNQICRGAARLVDAFGYRPGDVFHNWLPLYHLGGQMHMSMTAIIADGTIALFPRFSLSHFWAEVAEVKATVICGFSAIVQFLWSLPPGPQDRDNTLRVGLISGIPQNIHRDFESRFGMRLFEEYGGTEASAVTAPDPAHPGPLGSCGRATPEFEIAIVDENDRIVPAGTMGEIVMRPRTPDVMFRGYEDDGQATVEAWRNLWFHWGDLGQMDEAGFLTYKGRLKHAIRRRGENISSYEVEQIFRTHPDVAEVAAIGVPSPMGEEDVKAVIVPKTGRHLDGPSLHRFASDRMARFMVPRYIEFRDALPYTNLGKLECEKLREPADGVWDAERAGERSET